MEIRSVLALVALGVLTWVAFGALRYVQRLKEEVARESGRVGTLERDLQALCAGVRGWGDAVVRLEGRVHRVSERQDELALREPDQGVYLQAIRLVQQGAGVEDLVASCALPQSEAELLYALHRNAERTEPPARPRRRARA
jgi:hypothetical protein